MIGTLALAGKARGFRRYDKGKMEAWGNSLKPGSRCPNARKNEIVIIFLAAIRPMRQLSKGYA
jgi:hypothetical protein